MKRLNLKQFKTQHQPSTKTEQLLGQILGDCHDDHNDSAGSGPGSVNGHWDKD